MDALCLKAGGIHGMMGPPIGNGDLRSSEKPSVSAAVNRRNSNWGFAFRRPLRALWPVGKNGNEDDVVLIEEEKQKEGYNWVSKILRVNSIWTSGEKNPIPSPVAANRDEISGDESELCAVDDYGEEIKFDRESFSKLLRNVPLEETRSYEKLSYLGYLAYSISQIKPESLLKHHGLRFITSSLEKKQQASKSETKEEEEESSSSHGGDAVKPEEKKNADGNNQRISVSIAYQIAASAASYLHSHTRTILRFGDSSYGNDDDMASIIATDSVTAVVAAKEEVKQAVADDLNSTKSSPCDWFVCDDDRSATRFFVIQGSESLASWQANLLFEPVPFEGFDVLIHRGIYEAAKGMYELILPLIRSHLKRFGKSAKFRFTGHSLGGSLSLVINLMLLARGVVPRNSGGGGLLPVITFGSPSVMCGGDRLLRKLGLPRSHVQSITMHRDIVPRAFSCSYPKHVAEFLKAVNGNFRTLPCLNYQKHLYGHMGEFLILQPDSRISPSHDLLPSGSGLYLLTCPESEGPDPDKMIHVARSAFMNSPHPLEILSDRSAYGSGGTIHRDHDMITYLKSVRNVIRKELNRLRRDRRNRRPWWPAAIGSGARFFIIDRPAAIAGMVMRRKGELLSLSGVMIRSGGEGLKKLRKLVTSGNVHLIVVLLIPVKLLILGMYNLVKFH